MVCVCALNSHVTATVILKWNNLTVIALTLWHEYWLTVGVFSFDLWIANFYLWDNGTLSALCHLKLCRWVNLKQCILRLVFLRFWHILDIVDFLNYMCCLFMHGSTVCLSAGDSWWPVCYAISPVASVISHILQVQVVFAWPLWPVALNCTAGVELAPLNTLT